MRDTFAGAGLHPVRLLYPANIRFPMERANGIQTAQTCHALARRGVVVDLVVRRSDSRTDEACLEFFGLAPHPNLNLRRLSIPVPGSAWGRLAFAAKCLPLFASRRYDAVFTRDLVLADLALRTKWYHRHPVIYEAHTAAALFSEETSRLYQNGNAPQPSIGKLRRLTRRERRVCRRATAIVALTHGLLTCLSELHTPLAPVRVIPNATEIPAEMPPPPARSSDQPLQVYYVGQLYPWKGVDVLIESMKHIAEAELVVIGGLLPEPDIDRVRRLAERLRLADRIHFRGFLSPPKVAKERLNADLFVIPMLDSMTARVFTLPLKLFEAMASGRAIVASDLPSLREVLKHEENALLVPPGKPEALAAAFERLARDPEEAKRLATQAAEDAKRYSWEERGRKLSDLLTSVVG